MDEFNAEEMFRQYQNENEELKQENLKMASAMNSAGLMAPEDENLIHYKLETDKILERVEHFLKGDQIKVDERGSYYVDPTKNVLCLMKKDVKLGIIYYIQEIPIEKGDKKVIRRVCVKIENKTGEQINLNSYDGRDLMKKIKNFDLEFIGYKYAEVLDDAKKPLNEYGVAELMRIMSMYVTKETFLSNYKEDRINEILADLGDALTDFIFCNYEKMGMDTKFKESKYILIVENLLHTVESCYRRALGGQEQRNMQTRALITQSGNMGGGSMPAQKPSFNPLKPRTW